MKLRLILSLFVALVVAGGTYANSSFRFVWDDQLILKGEFIEDMGNRSVTPTIPMEAGITNNVLGIEFWLPVGDVSITVSGPTETVYSSSVHVSTVGQQTSFSLDGLAPGAYLLEIKNAHGGYVFAEFIVD